jgi:hypothetical protein
LGAKTARVVTIRHKMAQFIKSARRRRETRPHLTSSAIANTIQRRMIGAERRSDSDHSISATRRAKRTGDA